MSGWLIAIVVLLILGLLACLARHWCGPRTGQPLPSRLWAELTRFGQAFFPNFASAPGGQAITETFRLLVGAMILFGIFLMAWAGGAAVLRAASLVADPLHPVPPVNLAVTVSNTGRFWVLLIVEVLRAIGGISVICFASGLVGGFFGFLFGLPQPSPAGSNPPPPTTRGRYQSSTNLSDISDWLTKIIVGVSLVTAAQIWGDLQTLAHQAAGWLFGLQHGSPAVVTAAIIGGGILGFMFIYLYTQVIVAPLIAQADTELANLPDTKTVQTIDDMKSFNEAMVPRISRRMQEFNPGTEPSYDQITAALRFRGVKLPDLTKRSDVRNWARARAVVNDYKAAADAYTHLLGIPDDGTVATGPDLLIEAARVMNAAGDRPTEAASVAELARSKLATAANVDTDVKEAIIGDAAALRLSRRAPGGFESAIALLTEALKPAGADKSGRLHLLCALANGQKWHATADPAEKSNLKTAIMEDLKAAIGPGKQRFSEIRPFWDMTVPRSLHRMPGDNEDDLVGILDQPDRDALAAQETSQQQTHP